MLGSCVACCGEAGVSVCSFSGGDNCLRFASRYFFHASSETPASLRICLLTFLAKSSSCICAARCSPGFDGFFGAACGSPPVPWLLSLLRWVPPPGVLPPSALRDLPSPDEFFCPLLPCPPSWPLASPSPCFLSP